MANTMRCLRAIALLALLVAMNGVGVAGSGGHVAAASATDCGDGHKWDDAQQMCVDQEPSDCLDGQVWDDTQQMCVDSTSEGSDADQPIATDTPDDESDGSSSEVGTETPTTTPTATAPGVGTGSIIVSVFGCPPGYDPSGPAADPVNDCPTPVGGVQVSYRLADQAPVVQTAAAGSTTFMNLVAGPFSLDVTPPTGMTAVSWMCGSGSGQPLTGTGARLSAQLGDGGEMFCAFFVSGKRVATGSPVPNFAAASGSPAPSLTGPGNGSIRITLSMCPPGFDLAGDVKPGDACGVDYRLVTYPLTFTAIGKSSDASTPGVVNTFLDWITFDGLEPDTYRVQAPLPAGISAIVDKYGTCGDMVSTGGLVAFDMKIDPGGFVSCYLAAVPDPAAPTPTRAPNTNDSSLSFDVAVCPPGYTFANPGVAPKKDCVSGKPGVALGITGPTGAVASGTDSVSTGRQPGAYHVTMQLPEGIVSIAASICTVYDLVEQQWVDDVSPVIAGSGTGFSTDIDLPGAMIWSCTVFVVPAGPSPTPSPTMTLTPTVTPTPTMTAATSSQVQTSTGSSGSSGSTSRPPASQGSGQGGPASSSTGANTGSAAGSQPSGKLSIIVNTYLCDVGAKLPADGMEPDDCFTAYPGVAFTVQDQQAGVDLLAISGDILPDAAYFTELPAGTYTITQQAAPGIVGSFGTCALLDEDAPGSPMQSLPVTDGVITHTFDAEARVFVCDWYSIPDATFAGIPTPTPPQGVSLTVHAFTCPTGYDPSSDEANPTVDCLLPARGVPFFLAGDSGTDNQLTTGDDSASTNPQNGTSHSGTVTFTGLEADTYTLTQGNAGSPANAFVTSCSLATAQDPEVPIYPTVSNGSIQQQLNDNEALTCFWYTIPGGTGQESAQMTATVPAAQGAAPPSEGAQGGATDDDAQGAAPPSGSEQGGATDDDAQNQDSSSAGVPQPTESGSVQEGATDDEAQQAAPPSDGVASGEPSILYLFAYQCPAGYDPDGSGANPSGDCTEQPDGVQFGVAATSAEISRQATTGDEFPGGVMVTDLAPGSYRITQTLETGQRAFAMPCDVNGSADGSAKPPITLTVSEKGDAEIAIPAGVTISCNWYIVPSTGARDSSDDSASLALLPWAPSADRAGQGPQHAYYVAALSLRA
ncbi:MAG: hypothetical protein QM589_01140 [Thermomicrobiales bacterium]